MSKYEGTERREDGNSWHLEKKVTITLIVAILLQTVVIIWSAARLASDVDESKRRISTLEIQIDKYNMLSERLVRIETIAERIERRMEKR